MTKHKKLSRILYDMMIYGNEVFKGHRSQKVYIRCQNIKKTKWQKVEHKNH